MIDQQKESLPGLSRRVHGLVSYAGAAIVLTAFLLRHHANHPVLGLSDGAWISASLWTAHFIRRTVEVLWVHRYGAGTLPWKHVLFPWAYYWGFAMWTASGLASPDYSLMPWWCSIPGAGLFFLGEAGNAYSHILLRRLRSADGGSRAMPHGFLFEHVSCPHYFFEIVAWFGFTLVTGVTGAVVFTLATTAILFSWATQRHRGYLQSFDGREGRQIYPEKRKVIIPFMY